MKKFKDLKKGSYIYYIDFYPGNNPAKLFGEVTKKLKIKDIYLDKNAYNGFLILYSNEKEFRLFGQDLNQDLVHMIYSNCVISTNCLTLLNYVNILYKAWINPIKKEK